MIVPVTLTMSVTPTVKETVTVRVTVAVAVTSAVTVTARDCDSDSVSESDNEKTVNVPLTKLARKPVMVKVIVPVTKTETFFSVQAIHTNISKVINTQSILPCTNRVH